MKVGQVNRLHNPYLFSLQQPILTTHYLNL